MNENPFAIQEADLASLYRDSAAPNVAPDTEALVKATTEELAAKAATAPAPVPAPVAAPDKPNANSTANASPETASVLQRFRALGINSLDDLRGKTDEELRELSGKAIAFELRQQSLAKAFARNPDGSWDFTKGPDGLPTGLGPDGKVLPPQAAAPAQAAAASPGSVPTAPAVAPPPRPVASPAPPPAAPAPPPVAAPPREAAPTAAETRVTNRVVAPAPKPVVRTTTREAPTTLVRVATTNTSGAVKS